MTTQNLPYHPYRHLLGKLVTIPYHRNGEGRWYSPCFLDGHFPGDKNQIFIPYDEPLGMVVKVFEHDPRKIYGGNQDFGVVLHGGGYIFVHLPEVLVVSGDNTNTNDEGAGR